MTPQLNALLGRPTNALVNAGSMTGNALVSNRPGPSSPSAPVLQPAPPAAPSQQPMSAMQAVGQQLQAMKLQPQEVATRAGMLSALVEVLSPLARSKSVVTYQDLVNAALQALEKGLFPAAEVQKFISNFDVQSKDLRPALRRALESAVMRGSHLTAQQGPQPPAAPQLQPQPPAVSPPPMPASIVPPKQAAPAPIPSHYNGWATASAPGAA